VKRGLTEEEALQQQLDVPSLDPYPIGQRLFAMSDRLNGMNVSKHLQARHGASGLAAMSAGSGAKR